MKLFLKALSVSQGEIFRIVVPCLLERVGIFSLFYLIGTYFSSIFLIPVLPTLEQKGLQEGWCWAGNTSEHRTGAGAGRDNPLFRHGTNTGLGKHVLAACSDWFPEPTSINILPYWPLPGDWSQGNYLCSIILTLWKADANTLMRAGTTIKCFPSLPKDLCTFTPNLKYIYHNIFWHKLSVSCDVDGNAPPPSSTLTCAHTIFCSPV